MVKNQPASAGDAGSFPGSGRYPAEGNSNPLQYSCLGNPMDRGAWWVTVHRVTVELATAEHAHTHHLRAKKLSKPAKMLGRTDGLKLYPVPGCDS